MRRRKRQGLPTALGVPRGGTRTTPSGRKKGSKRTEQREEAENGGLVLDDVEKAGKRRAKGRKKRM